MSDERIEWFICGRHVGTATGWDQEDIFAMIVYNLEPVEGFLKGPGDYTFDFGLGKIEMYDNEKGKLLFSGDLVEELNKLKKRILKIY